MWFKLKPPHGTDQLNTGCWCRTMPRTHLNRAGPSSGTWKGMQGQLELKKNPENISLLGLQVCKSTPRWGTEAISHCNLFESTNRTGLELMLRTQVRGMIRVDENKGTHPVRASSWSLHQFLMHITEPGSLWETRHAGRMDSRWGMRE
jgi:hypothetical protein